MSDSGPFPDNVPLADALELVTAKRGRACVTPPLTLAAMAASRSPKRCRQSPAQDRSWPVLLLVLAGVWGLHVLTSGGGVTGSVGWVLLLLAGVRRVG